MEKKAYRFRSDIEIAAAILELTTTGTRFTHIMGRVSLSYDACKRHLDRLLTRGLLVYHPESRTYITTLNGRAFLATFAKIKPYLT